MQGYLNQMHLNLDISGVSGETFGLFGGYERRFGNVQLVRPKDRCNAKLCDH